MYKNRIVSCFIIKTYAFNGFIKNIMSIICFNTYKSFSNIKNIFIKNIESKHFIQEQQDEYLDNHDFLQNNNLKLHETKNYFNDDWGWFVSFD
jgi:hypothetical protein